MRTPLSFALAMAIATPLGAQTIDDTASSWPVAGSLSTSRTAPSVGVFLVATGNFSGGREWFDLSASGQDPAASGNAGSPSQFGHAQGGLTFSAVRSRFSLTASADAYGTFHSTTSVLTHGHRADTRGTYRLTRRTSLAGDVTYDRRPLSLGLVAPGLLGADTGALLADYLFVGGTAYESVRTSAGLTHAFTRRLQGAVRWSREMATGDDGSGRRDDNSVMAGVGYALGRGLSIRLGYGRQAGTYTTAQGDRTRFSQHMFDTGLQVGGAVALTRRTALSFRTGTAAFSDGTAHRFDVVGGLTLTRQWSRRWTTAVTVDRQFYFADLLNQPTFTNTALVNTVGAVSRRMRVRMAGGISQGGVGVSRTAEDFRSLYASTGLDMQVPAVGVVYGDYSFAAYRFSAGTTLPGAVAPEVGRHAIQVGLTVGLPLLGSARRGINVAR